MTPALGLEARSGMIGAVRPVLRLLLGAALLLAVTASPAAADDAKPGDYRSEVTRITPDTGAVQAEIRGADAFLELTVEPGHEVTVAGYQGEPYLRFQEDGTVQRNELSQATYVNDSRTAQGAIPADASEWTSAYANGDADLRDPEWIEVGSGGTYAWHDHRTHWMSEASPSVDRGEYVPGAYDPWTVPLDVDGTEVAIEGRLLFAQTTSPLPWIALALLSAGLLAVIGRRAPVRSAAVALLVTGVLATITGRAEWSATPGGGNPLLWVLAAAAVAAAALGLALATRPAGVVLVLASVASLSGWALLRLQVILEPILPTDLPFALDRASVALALGVSLGAAYLAVTSGALALPSLDDDEPPAPAPVSA
jgi:hypothetical protein